ncbi:hypothetical protein AMTR_s00069p00179470 [Amborella trichopoda]|uniref:Uncharacterized protein n=1 Tax=Amborella trichopoda TaxID=13333 RepID=U5DAB6_AMBTC|nr:hypothetical protein AMTR_s00069p00179470 [Amborella trichopoda]
MGFPFSVEHISRGHHGRFMAAGDHLGYALLSTAARLLRYGFDMDVPEIMLNFALLLSPGTSEMRAIGDQAARMSRLGLQYPGRL